MSAITSTRAKDISIGELSKLSGVNIETIRYYERIKMLPAPPRTASGRRLYGPAEKRTLAFIRRSRDLRRYAPCWTLAGQSALHVSTCTRLRAHIWRKFVANS
jgi:MerR family regulatory protein